MKIYPIFENAMFQKDPKIDLIPNESIALEVKLKARASDMRKLDGDFILASNL